MHVLFIKTKMYRSENATLFSVSENATLFLNQKMPHFFLNTIENAKLLSKVKKKNSSSGPETEKEQC